MITLQYKNGLVFSFVCFGQIETVLRLAISCGPSWGCFKLFLHHTGKDSYPDSKVHGANMAPTWWTPCWPQEPCYRVGANLQHRISATGWLLFMRCVSFTFVRLLPTWTPTEIFDSFWAKHFSDCDSIICPIKSKLRFLKVCKILKRTWHFQTDWILCDLNCSGCTQWRWLHVFLLLISGR